MWGERREPTEALNELWAAWLGVLFPELCRGCGRPLRFQECLLCERCWVRLFWVSEPAALETVGRGWCRANGIPFRIQDWPAGAGQIRARAVAYMEPVLAAVIHEFKYGRRRKAADRLGRWMAQVALADPEFRYAEGLVPIPLRPEKVRERGYNPATLLALAVAARTGWAVLDGALIKARPTPSQTEVRPRERSRNPGGSFVARDGAGIVGRRLVLVDDVLTSGSTVAAAAGALLEAGAAEVHVLTAVRTPVERRFLS